MLLLQESKEVPASVHLWQAFQVLEEFWQGCRSGLYYFQKCSVTTKYVQEVHEKQTKYIFKIPLTLAYECKNSRAGHAVPLATWVTCGVDEMDFN